VETVDVIASRSTAAVLRKDLSLEWHSRARLFAVLPLYDVLLLFSFAAGPDSISDELSGIFVVSPPFGSVLLRRIVSHELEDDALSPCNFAR